MTNLDPKSGSNPTIRDLYPDMGEDRQRAAEENLERYLELMLRIYQRIREDPEAYAQFRALTASKKTPTLERERSNHVSDSNHPQT
jgi:hypothetical protein